MRRLTLFICIADFINASSLMGQSYLTQMKDLFDAKSFQQAYDFGITEIETLGASNTRNLYLEFFTFAALTASGDEKRREYGCSILTDYLANNQQHFKQWGTWRIISKKKDSLCALKVNISTAPLLESVTEDFSYHQNSQGGSLNANFKTYNVLHERVSDNNFFAKLSQEDFERLTNVQMASVKIIPDKKPEKIYALRIIPKDSAAAVDDYVKTVYPGAKFFRSKNFVTVSRQKSPVSLKRTAVHLEKVLLYYNSRLQLPVNRQFIFIYLSRNYQDPSMDIDLIYGRNVSGSILGFTDMKSKSVVAWLPGDTLVGTLKHELIHILLFNHNQFMPEWFEEGLATLFEESRFRSPTSLVGIRNWRKRFIDALDDHQARNLFNGLVLSNDSLLQEVRGYIKQQVNSLKESAKRAHHYDIFKDQIAETMVFFGDDYMRSCRDAMSRYIVYYLQSRGVLDNLIRSMLQNRQFNVTELTYTSFTENLLKYSGHKGIEAFNASFFMWLAKQK